MVYVFLAEGFEEIEALAVVDVLRRGAVQVRTVGIGGRQVAGAHGIPVVCDLAECEAATDGLEMVVRLTQPRRRMLRCHASSSAQAR